MTWAIIDADTGELIERDLDQEPVPAAGLTMVRQPRGAGWDWSAPVRGWIKVDLADVRRQRWSAVKAARDGAEGWGCSTPLGRVDTDEDSQRKVVGAVTMAMIADAVGQPFAITWTMQNNSAVDHDGPAMIAMGAAVGVHVAACHAVGRAKRLAIDAAGDRAAIEAVSIEEGWPDAP